MTHVKSRFIYHSLFVYKYSNPCLSYSTSCCLKASSNGHQAGDQKFKSYNEEKEIKHKGFMKAWQLNSFDGVKAIQHSDAVKVPYITDPNDVLVEVCASSVNPLDLAMANGYGQNVLEAIRQVTKGSLPDIFSGQPEFPFPLGRDFSGHVVDKGFNVHDLDIGDQVFGVVSPHRPGAHAEYTVVRKPQKLNHTESAAIPYAALTAWSALCVTGHISSRNASKMRVLVLGGSGGVGTFSIQLLKHWGAEVVTTCGPEAVELMLRLGANVALSYTDSETEGELLSMKGFDVILDAAGTNNPKYLDMLKPWKYSKYVTLSPPFLSNTDTLGLAGGLLKNVFELTSSNILSHIKGSSYRWAFFTPNRYALKEVRNLLDDGKLKKHEETSIANNEIDVLSY
ncbi:hypothetical protein QYM36_009903 [Artemia franciscana]|uniref:Enoyl reductase (ER) domain-containing protein n=1 Tax=Artemia franciscana TaxID=6661 RepID=A0AA88I3P4_ARTSF|nr:hypothetical protein QYM36_009903 [Artemia franciscana]